MTFICTFHCKQNLEIGRHFQGSWTSLRSVYWVSCNARFLPAVSTGVHKLTGASWFLSQLQSLILQRVADCSHDSLIYLDFIVSRWMCENQGRHDHDTHFFVFQTSSHYIFKLQSYFCTCLVWWRRLQSKSGGSSSFIFQLWTPATVLKITGSLLMSQ